MFEEEAALVPLVILSIPSWILLNDKEKKTLEEFDSQFRPGYFLANWCGELMVLSFSQFRPGYFNPEPGA